MVNKNDKEAADKVTEVINDEQEQEVIVDISAYVLSKSHLVVMVDDLKEKLAYGGNTEGNKLLIFNKKHYKSKYIAIDIKDNGDIMLTCSYKSTEDEQCISYESLKKYIQELADFE